MRFAHGTPERRKRNADDATAQLEQSMKMSADLALEFWKPQRRI